ncbi:HAD family phosphatase, partial [Candidatus Woesearchaeota archaeon]|nr:HAD family phosphatase [Candidatus Woesearchaeota archaeon]
MIKAIIFDLDGVLIDSEGLSFQALQQTVGEFGITLTEKDRESYTGETTTQILTLISKK